MNWSRSSRSRGDPHPAHSPIGLVALVACTFVGAYAYTSARSALVEATRDRLALAAENRVGALQGELDATSRGIATLLLWLNASASSTKATRIRALSASRICV
jgi:hypothetical protein